MNGDVYVANYGSSDVSVINGTTNGIVAVIPVYAAPRDLAVDGFNGCVYVADTGGEIDPGTSVEAISGVNESVVAVISVAPGPWTLAVDPRSGIIYVASFVAPQSYGTVSGISRTTNAVLATIPVGIDPVALAIDPARDLVYVPDDVPPGQVDVIAGAALTLAASVPVAGPGSDAVVDETNDVGLCCGWRRRPRSGQCDRPNRGLQRHVCRKRAPEWFAVVREPNGGCIVQFDHEQDRLRGTERNLQLLDSLGRPVLPVVGGNIHVEWIGGWRERGVHDRGIHGHIPGDRIADAGEAVVSGV